LFAFILFKHTTLRFAVQLFDLNDFVTRRLGRERFLLFFHRWSVLEHVSHFLSLCRSAFRISTSDCSFFFPFSLLCIFILSFWLHFEREITVSGLSTSRIESAVTIGYLSQSLCLSSKRMWRLRFENNVRSFTACDHN
jgi:hypothetical protein